MSPASRPTATATTRPSARFACECAITSASAAVTRPAFEPTEMSRLPEIITMTSPIVTTPRIEPESRMDTRLVSRNSRPLLATPNTTSSTARAATRARSTYRSRDIEPSRPGLRPAAGRAGPAASAAGSPSAVILCTAGASRMSFVAVWPDRPSAGLVNGREVRLRHLDRRDVRVGRERRVLDDVVVHLAHGIGPDAVGVDVVGPAEADAGRALAPDLAREVAAQADRVDVGDGHPGADQRLGPAERHVVVAPRDQPLLRLGVRGLDRPGVVERRLGGVVRRRHGD